MDEWWRKGSLYRKDNGAFLLTDAENTIDRIRKSEKSPSPLCEGWGAFSPNILERQYSFLSASNPFKVTGL